MSLISNVEQSVFIPSPEQGTAAHGWAFYTRPTGNDLLSIHSFESRSDIIDVSYMRHSADNGRTWSEPKPWTCEIREFGGIRRRHPRMVYADPASGRSLFFYSNGVLPSDEPLEGMKNYTVWHDVSDDGFHSCLASAQIIHQDDDYDARHPLPGVITGQNCYMIGDMGQNPITRSDGTILLPVQSSPLGPDGKYYNPGRGYTYTDCMVLFGRWRENGTLDWTSSERICGDPERSLRGMIEPSIASLSDGRILMVMRGSNDSQGTLPGYRWHALSSDGGETWSIPEPWTYEDGTAFHSPSSTSQLLAHSSGRLFWIGNVCKENSRANSPRYPIVLAEVDRESGCILRESVSVIDDRREGESKLLTLSNFYVREDREHPDQLVLHMSRLFAHQDENDSKTDWTSDSTLTRITLTGIVG